MTTRLDDRGDEVITLSDVFDAHFAELKVDKGMIDSAYRYQIGFLNRDSEHLGFFGSNLIGVHSIRFRVADTLKFYKDVCKVDYAALEKDLATVTTIVQEYKISSDAMNLTIMYLIHRILSSPKLTQSQRERGAYDMALIFFYRCIAIRQSTYFNFPADPKISQAAYANLSNKFLIKKLGSWRAVMEYRAKELLDKKAVHYPHLVAFDDDAAISYAISDGEGRIKDMYKNYCVAFYAAYDAGSKIQTTSSTIVDTEGEEKVREKIKSTEQYVNMIRSLIVDKNGFVKSDLVKIITEINTNTSQRMLTSSLTWMVEASLDPTWNKKIDEWLSLVIVHSFYLLTGLSAQELRDYPTMLTTLKNLYLSTRSVDAELLRIRKLGDELVKAANGKVNSSLAMATRTSLILYVTLRALIGAR